MLRRTSCVLAISPYSMFLKSEAKSALYQKLTVGERGKALSARWKSLTKTQRKNFAEKAQKESYAPRAPKTTVSLAAPVVAAPSAPLVVLSDYHRFVQRKFPKLTGNPRQRLRRIAKLWQERPA
ncbi:kinetoplast-associated protein, putative [Bodo saltans]|uniref:Kinetoplast-associated protein, putative n=1 Tax=Bodo saltans TaxID=75058 RepID=A0A0S4JH10_BODSA|nr:kinetoplast-associated protein, putative [Bodo saltans]|eukprot:CUG88302.1 kinetoplast-associated protein, putative [Bodo saltans]